MRFALCSLSNRVCEAGSRAIVNIVGFVCQHDVIVGMRWKLSRDRTLSFDNTRNATA